MPNSKLQMKITPSCNCIWNAFFEPANVQNDYCVYAGPCPTIAGVFTLVRRPQNQQKVLLNCVQLGQQGEFINGLD